MDRIERKLDLLLKCWLSDKGTFRKIGWFPDFSNDYENILIEEIKRELKIDYVKGK